MTLSLRQSVRPSVRPAKLLTGMCISSKANKSESVTTESRLAKRFYAIYCRLIWIRLNSLHMINGGID